VWKMASTTCLAAPLCFSCAMAANTDKALAHNPLHPSSLQCNKATWLLDLSCVKHQ
jgi:hypothetical protein